MPETRPRPNPKELFYGSVTIGERGQIVIPAEARKFYDLTPGDKLLVFRHPNMHGMVLAPLDNMESLLGEMRQWMDLMAQVQAQEVGGLSARKKRRKKGEERA